MAASKGRKDAPEDDAPSGIVPILGVMLVVIILYAIVSMVF